MHNNEPENINQADPQLSANEEIGVIGNDSIAETFFLVPSKHGDGDQCDQLGRNFTFLLK
jgi:hypothetical protein